MPLLITTSHKPSPRTRTFIKDLASMLPFAFKTNRGKKTLEDLGLEAYRRGARYIFVVGEKRGNPSLIRIYRLELAEKPHVKHFASIKIAGIKLLRENPEGSRVYNPESICVDYENCRSDQCYMLANIFIEIFHANIVKEKPDIKLVLEEINNITIIKPLNRLNKVCGPIIKVSGVK
ncbi:MAG: hypothetical protein ABWW65_07070, partial [Thermoprotei archaeon]